MKKLDSKAVWLLFISAVLKWFFGLFFIWFLFAMQFVGLILEGVGIPDYVWSFGIKIWLIIISLPILLSFIWARLFYESYRYKLDESVFLKEYGVVWKKYVSTPYDKIQNVDIHRGMLARILGLSTIRIQTAGVAGGIEGGLPGLSQEVAEELRDELIEHARQLTAKNRGL